MSTPPIELDSLPKRVQKVFREYVLLREKYDESAFITLKDERSLKKRYQKKLNTIIDELPDVIRYRGNIFVRGYYKDYFGIVRAIYYARYTLESYMRSRAWGEKCNYE